MTKVEVELPEEAFSALRATPEEFVREMRFAAAAHWYHQKVISGSKAGQIAGMSRLEFLDELARRKLNVLNIDIDDLERELKGA
jgi:predicted HTH domain antitoxin